MLYRSVSVECEYIMIWNLWGMVSMEVLYIYLKQKRIRSYLFITTFLFH